jgi:hypothetical protein
MLERGPVAVRRRMSMRTLATLPLAVPLGAATLGGCDLDEHGHCCAHGPRAHLFVFRRAGAAALPSWFGADALLGAVAEVELPGAMPFFISVLQTCAAVRAKEGSAGRDEREEPRALGETERTSEYYRSMTGSARLARPRARADTTQTPSARGSTARRTSQVRIQ